MKPCRNFRKPIALHAADALEPGETRTVRQHLAECPACQQYLDSMQNVCGDHRLAGLSLRDSAPLPEPMLRRVTERLEPCETSARPIRLGLPRLAWSFAALALAALLWRQINSQKTQEIDPTPLRTIAVEDSEPPSSHMAYRLALNQSFEQLDRLLAKTADQAAAAPARSLYQTRLTLAEGGF